MGEWDHFHVEHGVRIRNSRVAAGISIRDLARAVGTTPGAVSHWETGRLVPRRERQIAIAAAVGVPWVEIFGLEGQPAVAPTLLAQ